MRILRRLSFGSPRSVGTTASGRIRCAGRLTGASACITNAAATLSYTKVSSRVSSPVNKVVSTSAATSGNQFRYDATSGQYLFNWGTKGLTSGTYQLQIDLGDEVSRTVSVQLR